MTLKLLTHLLSYQYINVLILYEALQIVKLSSMKLVNAKINVGKGIC